MWGDNVSALTPVICERDQTARWLYTEVAGTDWYRKHLLTSLSLPPSLPPSSLSRSPGCWCSRVVRWRSLGWSRKISRENSCETSDYLMK